MDRDAGSGSLDQYAFNLVPRNGRVTLRLAGSDPCQEEIARVRDSGADSFEAFFAPRTIEEERTDAAMPAFSLVRQNAAPAASSSRPRMSWYKAAKKSSRVVRVIEASGSKFPARTMRGLLVCDAPRASVTVRLTV